MSCFPGAGHGTALVWHSKSKTSARKVALPGLNMQQQQLNDAGVLDDEDDEAMDLGLEEEE